MPSGSRGVPLPVRDALSIVVTSALLLSVAVYNRYPLTYWDTHTYLRAAGTLMPRPDRPIGYSLFIRATSLLETLWLTVVAQSLLVAFLLWSTFRRVAPAAGPRPFLAVAVGLTLLSAAPWMTGQLMPDIFTCVLVLAVFLLLEEPDARLARRALLGVAIATAVASHLTHLWLGVVLIGVHALSLRWTGERLHVRALVAPIAALALGFAGIASYNFVRTGNPSPAAGQSAFVLGHLIDTGIAQRMLAEHCPERGYLLCAYKDRLAMSGDDFLWGGYLPINPWDVPAAIHEEAHRLLYDSLREHPLLHVKNAVTFTLRALVTFETGEALDSQAVFLIKPRIAEYVPADLDLYLSARQQSSVLPVPLVRVIQTPIAFASVAFNVGLVVARALATRRKRHATSGETVRVSMGVVERVPASGVRFAACLIALFVFNAALTGNLSCVNNRYGARMVWLLVFSMFASVTRVRGLVGPPTKLARPCGGLHAESSPVR